MNKDAAAGVLADLAAHPGITGCAIVDAATGMAWLHAGSMEEIERFGEAAVEFWRVQSRLGAYFRRLGTPQSAAVSFRDGVVALFPCCDDPELVLVCVTHRKDIQWQQWGAAVPHLKVLLARQATVA